MRVKRLQLREGRAVEAENGSQADLESLDLTREIFATPVGHCTLFVNEWVLQCKWHI